LKKGKQETDLLPVFSYLNELKGELVSCGERTLFL